MFHIGKLEDWRKKELNFHNHKETPKCCPLIPETPGPLKSVISPVYCALDHLNLNYVCTTGIRKNSIQKESQIIKTKDCKAARDSQ